ncbi:MAG: diphosphate--fructose-6-phosphate 1-phosphotransferase, partial [Tannerella sp.]|nr:diphosphate--fructose-6-phosphate 1-phosphotransferase [Tannerella sp.]
MEISALQTVRYTYQPKLPESLKLPVENIELSLGAPTESIADQSDLKALFANTYGKPLVSFVKGKNDKTTRKLNVGVI